MKPSLEYRQHHDVEAPRVDERAFRPGWRVRTRLDQLLASGRISRAEWQAASEYRATWVRALELTTLEPGMIRVGSDGSHDAAMVARLDAVGLIRIVEDAIGDEAARLLLAAVVHDLSWAVLGRFWHRHPETMRDWTVVAIGQLSSVWDRLGSESPPRRAGAGRSGRLHDRVTPKSRQRRTAL